MWMFSYYFPFLLKKCERSLRSHFFSSENIDSSDDNIYNGSCIVRCGTVPKQEISDYKITFESRLGGAGVRFPFPIMSLQLKLLCHRPFLNISVMISLFFIFKITHGIQYPLLFRNSFPPFPFIFKRASHSNKQFWNLLSLPVLI